MPSWHLTLAKPEQHTDFVSFRTQHSDTQTDPTKTAVLKKYRLFALHPDLNQQSERSSTQTVQGTPYSSFCFITIDTQTLFNPVRHSAWRPGMLVMSRKKSEVIIVGGSAAETADIRIVVLEIRGGQVRLGIEAPASVPVHRLEVWQQCKSAQPPPQQT
jgi:carbon storage regulator